MGIIRHYYSHNSRMKMLAGFITGEHFTYKIDQDCNAFSTAPLSPSMQMEYGSICFGQIASL